MGLYRVAVLVRLAFLVFVDGQCYIRPVFHAGPGMNSRRQNDD